MPPDNAGYLYAAYALAAFVYAGYALVLVRRRARARRSLAAGGRPAGTTGEQAPGEQALRELRG